MKLTPKQFVPFLVETIKARLPVLVSGAPGIGKSDLVDLARTEAQADLILSHPVVEDQTNASGFPYPSADHQTATFLPFGALSRAINAVRPTVWFLDDLGQATPAVQASYMQLLLARRVNEHVLPDCVTFVAATNRRTDRAGVSGILEPVKSRFASIVELEANLDDWITWAINKNIPAELIAFLRFRPELFCNFQASADLTNSPVPRTWNHVAKLFALPLSAEIQTAAIQGAVGEGPGTEFVAFVRLFRELPSVDQVLASPSTAPIPSSPAALYALTTAVATKANQNTIGRIGEYAERLVASAHGEFAVLMLRDSIRRDASVTQTREFVKLATGELGSLISGTN